MKKYYIIGLTCVALCALYFVIIHKRDGKFSCTSYEMLDDGYSESYLLFKDNSISHVYIEPGKIPVITMVGSYAKTGYVSVDIDERKLGIKCTLQSGLLGLYMSDKDASRMGYRFPRIGNVLYWRMVW